MKVELVEILRKIAPEPTYVLDEISRQQGHEVIRTPPYHPELQPIETCWGILKNEGARHCDFTLENLKRQLDHAFNNITAETCQRIIKKVRTIEERFWEEDARLDQAHEHLILQHGNFKSLSIHLQTTIDGFSLPVDEVFDAG